MATVKRVAVIGAGPAGAIAVDCLAQEKAFDVIRVFERRDRAGGCWIEDHPSLLPRLSDWTELANRTADKALQPPDTLPTESTKSSQNRHAETSVYPLLETNVDARVMEFSQEPIPTTKSALSIRRHGENSPFRHHTTIQQYVQSLLDRNGYQNFVEYNTTVEKVEKNHKTGVWTLTLRKEEVGKDKDWWWTEDFDAVLVANGHFTVPYLPHIDGLQQFATKYPGSVEHSKGYRGPEKYRGKKVVVVGSSVSGMDIAVDLIDHALSPVTAVVRGKSHPYFGSSAFDHPEVQKRPPISKIDCSHGNRTVYFEDHTFIENVDNIILGTGYSWSLPFLPEVSVRNNRVPDLYLHVFKRGDPTLCFIGAVAAGLTFKVYEWQSVLAARFLAGRIQLPSLEEQEQWEKDRIRRKGDGVAFTALYPDFEEYFEAVRRLAGEPTETRPGRKLPKFDKRWVAIFEAGHQKRIAHWKASNEAAKQRIASASTHRAKL